MEECFSLAEVILSSFSLAADEVDDADIEPRGDGLREVTGDERCRFALCGDESRTARTCMYELGTIILPTLSSRVDGTYEDGQRPVSTRADRV
jgi:hypothetical protein